MKHLLLATGFLAVIAGCSGGSTPEQRVVEISKPPHIEKERGDGKIIAILDDFPDSALVRLVVERSDGFMLSVLHPRCSPVKKGEQVGLISVDYMQTEMYSTVIFYIKE